MKRNRTELRRQEEELPRLFYHTYSTCDRPRRTKKLPPDLRDKICRSIEYPNGVRVDKKGNVQPLTFYTNALPLDDHKGEVFEQPAEDQDFCPTDSESTTPEEEYDSEYVHDSDEQTEQSGAEEEEDGEEEEQEEKAEPFKLCQTREPHEVSDEVSNDQERDPHEEQLVMDGETNRGTVSEELEKSKEQDQIPS